MNWASKGLLNWVMLFYAKYEGDGEYYHKELPTGEVYLVSVEL